MDKTEDEGVQRALKDCIRAVAKAEGDVRKDLERYVPDKATLDIVLPLLEEGLSKSSCCASIDPASVPEISNLMSNFIKDPIKAAPFLPLLLPALEFAANSVMDNRVAHAACAEVLCMLVRFKKDILDTREDDGTDLADVESILAEELKLGPPEKWEPAFTTLFKYMSAFAGALIDSSVDDTERWARLLTYVSPFIDAKIITEAKVTITHRCIELISKVRIAATHSFPFLCCHIELPCL